MVNQHSQAVPATKLVFRKCGKCVLDLPHVKQLSRKIHIKLTMTYKHFIVMWTEYFRVFVILLYLNFICFIKLSKYCWRDLTCIKTAITLKLNCGLYIMSKAIIHHHLSFLLSFLFRLLCTICELWENTTVFSLLALWYTKISKYGLLHFSQTNFLFNQRWVKVLKYKSRVKIVVLLCSGVGGVAPVFSFEYNTKKNMVM